MVVESDWGEWLPRTIEQASPDGVAVWFLGGTGFVLKGWDGTTVFVDPFLDKRVPSADDDYPRVRMIPVPFHPADVAEADAEDAVKRLLWIGM
jgi:L-ascorbate 6-phosphate lactonase